jgi:hypothetical protein
MLSLVRATQKLNLPSDIEPQPHPLLARTADHALDGTVTLTTE